MGIVLLHLLLWLLQWTLPMAQGHLPQGPIRLETKII
jgi:hypothetical protein